MANDLWALDLKPADIRTPVAILKEQAAVLGQRTSNLLEARVDVETTFHGEFLLGFVIVVPGLNFYEYKLFQVEHGVGQYPAVFVVGRNRSKVDSEEQFVEQLRRILSSEMTTKLVQELLGMIQPSPA